MSMRSLVLAASLCPVFAGISNAQDSAPGCGTFTVFGTVEARAFTDLGDTGATAGDQRVGRYKIVDDEGTELGRMHFAGVLMPPWDAAESPMMTTLHYRFANGSVVATSVVGLPAPSDTSIGPDLDLQYAITGGTGDFARVAGTLMTRTLDDGRRAMTFELSCE